MNKDEGNRIETPLVSTKALHYQKKLFLVSIMQNKGIRLRSLNE